MPRDHLYRISRSDEHATPTWCAMPTRSPVTRTC